MTPAEVLVLLGVATLYDARLGARSDDDRVAKANAWREALDTDMTAKFATQAVIAHYAEHTTGIMPADLNKAWRSERKRQRDIEASERLHREIEAAKAQAVPMPDSVRAMLAEMRSKRTL